MVWTVNDPAQMMEVSHLTSGCASAPSHCSKATRWNVDAILTDTTKTWLDLRSALQGT